MKVKTVKVENPKGYKSARAMNAGNALALYNYCRNEELRQITEIVKELLHETQQLDYAEGVLYAQPLIMQSDNTEAIKSELFKVYCYSKALEQFK